MLPPKLSLRKPMRTTITPLAGAFAPPTTRLPEPVPQDIVAVGTAVMAAPRPVAVHPAPKLPIGIGGLVLDPAAASK